MQSLEKRVEALEAIDTPADDFTIIRRFVSSGNADCEIQSLHDDEGNLWARQTGETEQELITRASLEVKRSPWGVASLTSSD